MIINISRQDLSKYFTLFPSLYIKDENFLYKDCLNSKNPPHFPQEILRYVNDLPRIDGINMPVNLLKDDIIYGYEETYLKSYSTLKEFVNTDRCINKCFEEKKLALLKVLKTLKEINKYYIIGDINSENIMINRDLDIKIIDWENGTPLHSDIPIFAYYYMDGTILQQDSLKMFLNCLSVIYNVDFENMFCTWDFFDIKSFFENVLKSRCILEFLRDFESILITDSKEVIYFDDYLKSMKAPGIIERKRCLNHFYEVKNSIHL